MIFRFESKPVITAFSCVGGKEEHKGPFGQHLDFFDETDKFDCDTWEKSESERQRRAFNHLLAKSGRRISEIDSLIAGDLINQCTSSGYGLLDFDVPYLGIFGACSTAALGMGCGALICDSGQISRAAVVTSSHFCSAERQFRFPLEYGSQRPPTAQHTATAAGAFLIENEGEGAVIEEFMVGITVDAGVTDANNMGAAMAPAACDTLLRYFRESNKKPQDFDLIVTGDLGREGYNTVKEFMDQLGYPMDKIYDDCGLMIYDIEKQDMHAGASGCGCSAFAMAASVLPDIISGKYKDVLFVGTGALLSKASVLQGESIPAVAHLVRITHKGGH